MHIYKIVERLKNKYKTNNPFEIADILNIFVSFKDLNKLKGFYSIINRERHIVINKDLCKEDSRLVCAHELGHDRLHQHLTKANELSFFKMNSQPEYEANIFAAELLLEDEQIVSILKEKDINLAAKYLYVSPHVLPFKLISMQKRGVLDATNQPLFDTTFLKDLS